MCPQIHIQSWNEIGFVKNQTTEQFVGLNHDARAANSEEIN